VSTKEGEAFRTSSESFRFPSFCFSLSRFEVVIEQILQSRREKGMNEGKKEGRKEANLGLPTVPPAIPFH